MTSAAANHSVVIIEESDPDPETISTISCGLDTYNEGAAGRKGGDPLWLVARNGQGDILGGVKGEIAWNWCYVAWLWVDEAARQGGLGSQLLGRAEAISIEKGCVGVFLNTFSFQAPNFYRSHGYREFGRLDNMPPGHSRIWFAKVLGSPILTGKSGQ